MVSSTFEGSCDPRSWWSIGRINCLYYFHQSRSVWSRNPIRYIKSHLVRNDFVLNHWDRVTHICVNKLTIIGSNNGLSPGQCHAIIRTSAGILFMGLLWTNFNEMFSVYIFSFKKMYLKLSSWNRRPYCLGLNVLKKSKQYIRIFWDLFWSTTMWHWCFKMHRKTNIFPIITHMLP